MSSFDVIIIGAGAAGLMCAIAAGARGKRVLLLDHNSQAGAKILISGGGRCNFTNSGTTPAKLPVRKSAFLPQRLEPLYAGGFSGAHGQAHYRLA